MKIRRILIQVLTAVLISGNIAYAQFSIPRSVVGQRTVHYEDASRNRKLTTEVWYPAVATAQPVQVDEIPFIRIATARNAKIAEGLHPLILFSHGTGGGRNTVEWFCAGLAEQGFIVAAVDHYGNTFDNPIPDEFVKIWNRPIDISFVLSQLLRDTGFVNAIDSSRIGAAGFSLGGFTVVALAGGQLDWAALTNFFKSPQGKNEINVPEMPGLINLIDKPEIQKGFESAPPLQDKRIKAIFAMSPAVGQGFPTKQNFSRVTIPTYIVTVGGDEIAPPKTNAAHYAKLIQRAEYTVIDEQAGHYVFLNEAKENLKNEAPIFFLDRPSVDRHAVHEKTLTLASTHFLKSLKKK